jgi:mRNA interferase RelE/StbE
MAYIITVRPGTLRGLALLPREVQSRVRSAVDRLADEPRPPRCVKLATFRSRYRIRVGAYRVVYEIDDGAFSIRVIAVGHRREVYR